MEADGGIRLAASAQSTCDQLTLVITTSPTPSAPSTELLSSVLDGFRIHCPGLLRCRLVVVIDTYDHIAPASKLKKGQITAEEAERFHVYRDNAKKFILQHFSADPDHGSSRLVRSSGEAEYGVDSRPSGRHPVPLTITQTADGRVTFVEPSQRLGFGLAVRSALRLTETAYVWIQQHDWALTSAIPIDGLLEVMNTSRSETGATRAPVEYVAFPSVRMLRYATSAHVTNHPELRAVSLTFGQDFTPASRPDVKIPLTPLFLWHDKPHMASTAHYLDMIFPNRLSISRGDFIEDRAGQRARTAMKAGYWASWGCWLYCPGQGRQLCLRHLRGRTYLGFDDEHKKRMAQKREGVRRHLQARLEAALDANPHVCA